MSTSPVSDAAAVLAARHRQQQAGPRLPASCRPADADTAFAVQDAVTALLGAEVGGWKCASPAADKLVAAPIFAHCIRRTPGPVPCNAARVRVEPELAFILGRDLAPRAAPWTEKDVLDAVGGAHLALELIGSRYQRPEEIPFHEHLADGLLNQGLFIGPAVPLQAVRAAASAQQIVIEAGSERMQLAGRHPDGNALLPLCWLAEFLRARGKGLHAGQAVITGSWAGSVELPARQDVRLRFGDLGSLAVRFDGP